MVNELADAIRTNAEGPKSASGDSGSMQQHPLPGQIAADIGRRTELVLIPSGEGRMRIVSLHELPTAEV